VALEALEDLLTWLKKPGSVVGIHDATNTTKARRKILIERIQQENDIKFLVLESICTNDEIIQNNLLVKLHSPDYANRSEEEALNDLCARIQEYEKSYEPVDDPENIPFIKMLNVSDKIIVNNIHGYLPSQIVVFLLNIHSIRRPIWLSRHGESEWNSSGKLGGNPSLSQRGLQYAQRLSEHFKKESLIHPKISVWTSTLQRTIQTVQYFEIPHQEWPALNEIDAGICEGMTYEEIKQKMPDVHHARTKDKLGYRYPGGESYIDVIERLKPVICELERQRTPILVIAHQAIIRTILSYFINAPQDNLPHVDVPLETLFQLTPTAFGCEQVKIDLTCDPIDNPKL